MRPPLPFSWSAGSKSGLPVFAVRFSVCHFALRSSRATGYANTDCRRESLSFLASRE